MSIIDNMTYTNQITIVHFSDLHFGKNHICNPEDITASSDGIPDLGELVTNDLMSDFGATFTDQALPSTKKEPPVIIAISGDFTQIAAHSEFEQAISFLNKLLKVKLLNQEVTKYEIFMIPGNHDVQFKKETADERFQPYCNFYNKFYSGIRPPLLPHDALSITQIHALNKEGNKILIAEINCCMYVQDETVDKSRGQVAIGAIKKLRKELNELKSNHDFDEYIKIAMIHHHVVLLPSFIEPGRGVDSVVHARHLLDLLSEFDFHLVLHGHKHYPHIFSYDPIPLWNESETKIPQLVIAGGSCGSSELPTGAINSCNTYGIITIKWHPAAQQARVRIISRGLKRKGTKGELTPDLWKWETVNISDKTIAPYQSLPSVKSKEILKWNNDQRNSHYEKLRGQMPIVEVMPSLIPSQAYEARVWITSHGNPLSEEKKLINVEWSAGKMFSKQFTTYDTNPNFCIAYQYWGPMLIEAKLTFNDGHEALGYVYARLPKKES